MKKLRRISILALVIVLVCAFSASAFAATYSDLEVYDEETYVDAYAYVNRLDLGGTLSLNAIGLNYCSLEISALYLYYDNNGILKTDYDEEVTGDTYCTLYKQYNATIASEMEKATFSFYAWFSSFSGDFTYSPADVTVYY